ncbi:MAG TPA: cbb3-type cytochrome oxidase assembly protein CcoS [Paracoccus sp.]|nr:cbb3-type cytochrome oxidase assembly protein CcoS [Paracoccus sp. (in: a-proteobacteria)]
MTALLILVPLSIGMGLVGLCAFVWALRRGQFDDPEGNAWRVIAPEHPPAAPTDGGGDRAREPGRQDLARDG